ncbi:hypothetical protein [Streptomyces sp. IBSBF 2806]|uniref:hypothetical protein n=1 Tax=Streptomyces sp. IBSBF 2806 TaxID=2903529 RepID=UPI002FDBBAFD
MRPDVTFVSKGLTPTVGTVGAACLGQPAQIARSDSFAGIEFLAPRPLLMIAGSGAVTAHAGRTNGRRTRRGAGAPAELFWVDGTSRFDLHGEDEADEYVSPP